jgi:cytoskeletal protein CcmA (bactofilin family)
MTNPEIIFKAYNLYEHSIDESNRRTGSYVMAKQPDGEFGYFNTNQFALTGSNVFVGNQTINGNLTINGNINANQFLVTTASITHYTASTEFGLDSGDTHRFTGSVRITGSLNTIGSSTMTGSFLVSGSTTQIGNNTLTGNTWLYGDIDVSGSTNFHNHTITMTGSMYTSGSQTITGSLDIKGNVNVASGSDFYLAGNKLFNYGQFSDTTTQSGSANTAYAKKLNTIDFAHNVSIVDGTKIKVDNTGIYNLQFSTQLANTANTNITFDIWLAYTGSNVANTNTQIDCSKTSGQLGRVVAAWNFMLPIHANDYVELMWSCNADTGQLAAFGTQTNPNRPAVPSVIATLTQIG